MTPTLRTGVALGSLSLALITAGCAGMDRHDRATTTGAVIGGVAGAVVTNSPVGAVVGAVVGGVIGSESEKKKK
jgi:osmotically inducible lipoprotein OsmB